MPLLTAYTEQDTPIQRLDPRTKLVWLGVVLVLSFAIEQPLGLVGLIAVVVVGSWYARLDLRSYVPVAGVVAALGICVILLQVLFYSGDSAILRVGPLGLRVAGFWLGIRVVLRLYCIVLAFLQFLTWTHPTDLALALVEIRLPYRYALLFGLTLRFFPVLEEDLGHIFAAQEARGLELQGSLRRALQLVPVALPFCLRSLRRSGEVALAMELRGFGAYPRRTFLRSIGYRPLDYVVTVGLMAALIAYFVVRAQYPGAW